MKSFHKSAANGLSDVVLQLLAKNRDINERDDTGATPLFAACYRGRTETAKLLIDNGADVNAGNNTNYTPLMVAAREGWIETVRLLVEHGANINATTDDGMNALMFSIVYSPSREPMLYLLSAGTDVYAKRSLGITALMSACSRGYIDIVKELIALGADPCAQRDNGATALDSAKKYDRQDIVDLLTPYFERDQT